MPPSNVSILHPISEKHWSGVGCYFFPVGGEFFFAFYLSSHLWLSSMHHACHVPLHPFQVEWGNAQKKKKAKMKRLCVCATAFSPNQTCSLISTDTVIMRNLVSMPMESLIQAEHQSSCPSSWVELFSLRVRSHFSLLYYVFLHACLTSFGFFPFSASAFLSLPASVFLFPTPCFCLPDGDSCYCCCTFPSIIFPYLLCAACLSAFCPTLPP